MAKVIEYKQAFFHKNKFLKGEISEIEMVNEFGAEGWLLVRFEESNGICGYLFAREN